MCIHTAAEWQQLQEQINDPNVAPVIMLKDGVWIGGWVVDVNEPIDVANVVRDLKVWHVGEFDTISLALVNEARRDLALRPLKLETLPAPTGEANPGIVDDEAAYREKIEIAQKSAAIRAFALQRDMAAAARR